ncbi:unnamed protein product, partial [Ectocarpus sp. 12 AP-2014]
MMMSATGRAASLAAVLLGLQQAGLAFAVPTCERVASQWAVIFSAECTQWFQQIGSRRGSPPESCIQQFTSAVLVENFPWNDDVVIVDNETPGDDFSLQPEQPVLKFGAGTVIMQTSWDMEDGSLWQPRMSSSAERVYAEVEYIASDNHNYLDFDLSVRYEPEHPPPGSFTRALSEDNDAPDEADVEEILELSATPPPLAQDANGDLSYEPAYVYSYELESYDFSYSFELEDLDSYSYEFIDSMFEEELSPYSQTYSYNFRGGEEVSVPPPSAVQSVTSLDIYVCTDEDNNLAELRFDCDPENDGDAQCFAEAGEPNVHALQIHGMDMYCDNVCLAGQEGGLWCDIFGLDGCRMCTDDCTSICDGEASCSSCILCGAPRVPPPPSPTDGSRGIPIMSGSPTMAPSAVDGSRGIETMSPTSSPTSSSSTGSRGIETTMSPTSLPSSGTHLTPAPSFEDGSMVPLEPSYMGAPTSSAEPTDGLSTASPAARVPILTAFPTPSPTATDRELPAASMAPTNAAETTAPSITDGSVLPLEPSYTDAPTTTIEPTNSMPNTVETPAPTTTDRELPAASKAPTNAVETTAPSFTDGSMLEPSYTDAPTTSTGPTDGMPTTVETASPTTTDRELPAASMAPTSVVDPTSAPTDGMPTTSETASPTTTDREIDSSSMAPTSIVDSTSAPTNGMPTTSETASPTTIDREIDSPSMAPTSIIDSTSAPTDGMPTTTE